MQQNPFKSSANKMELCDAITHAREVANKLEKEKKCDKCAAEHRQLASWLEELQQRREAQKGLK